MNHYFTKDWFYHAFCNENCVIRCSLQGVSVSAEADLTPEQKRILNDSADRVKVLMEMDFSNFLPDITLCGTPEKNRVAFDVETRTVACSAFSQMIQERYHLGIASYWHRHLNRDVPGYRPLNDEESELIRKTLSGEAYRPWAFRAPCEAMGALDRLSEKIASDLDAMDEYDPDALDWIYCISELRRKILIYGLPTITEPNMFYGIEVSRVGIAVQLFHIQISYDSADTHNTSKSKMQQPVPVKRRSVTLFSGMPYLSCAEYAYRCGVSENTVYEWIRRGELRSAVEKNGEWRIPADTKLPDGKFDAQTYSLKKEPIPENAVRAYPFLSFLPPGESFQIYENESGNYVVAPLIHAKPKSVGESVVTLNCEERERFEFYLLCAEWVEYEVPKYLLPLENRAQQIEK